MTRSHRVFMRVVLAAVLVAGWVEANPATAQDATELDRQILAVESNPDCSECESKLERALNALKEAKAEAAHLRERLSTSNGLLEDCRASRSRCRAGYARARLALGYCRSRLGTCSENIVRCRARVEHCSDALGECRDDLEECKGGQCCDPTLQPGVGGNPICFEGATCCNDGTWRCNQADGSPSCPGPVGDVCEEPSSCCDPTQEPGTHGNPYCFEGATCCGDGTWKCNAGDLSSTCDQEGFVCRDCCDERDRPPCIEGATCCGDGSWACNEGDGSPTCDLVGHVCESEPCRDPATGEATCCLVDGERKAIGDAFPAGDGCNVCTCSVRGVPDCTLQPCIEPAR